MVPTELLDKLSARAYGPRRIWRSVRELVRLERTKAGGSMTQAVEPREQQLNARAAWLTALQQFRGADWARPDDDRYWSTSLDTAPLEHLRQLQGEKLQLAVQYVYACIPFSRPT